jgi:Fe-S-cluster containining protein
VRAPGLDADLLRGFIFACRPGCGLCCYASPAVAPTERARLIEIAPEVELEEADGFSTIPSRPNGGACAFLSDARCRVHAARPFPCRTFPVTVHVGSRVQASLVLSCPGLSLEPLDGWANGTPPKAGPVGLETELLAVEEELAQSPLRRWTEEGARGEARWLAGRSAGESASERIRAAVLAKGLSALPAAAASDDLPSAVEGWENLPLFYSVPHGPVALGRVAGGIEAYALSESGRTPRSLGAWPTAPSDVPLTSGAARRLEGYLRYALARDQLLSSVAAERPPSDLTAWSERVREALGGARRNVLERALLRRRLEGGEDGPLETAEIDAGIRAWDAELLDRPVAGRIL